MGAKQQQREREREVVSESREAIEQLNRLVGSLSVYIEELEQLVTPAGDNEDA